MSRASEVVQELAGSADSWDNVVSPFDIERGAAHVLPPVSSFRLHREDKLDKNDIFSCIGSHNNTRQWKNPAETGEVSPLFFSLSLSFLLNVFLPQQIFITSSESLADGSLSNLVSGNGGLCLSSNSPGTWFMIDLGLGRFALVLSLDHFHI